MGHERRTAWALAVLVVAVALVAVGATASEPPTAESFGEGPYAGNTLVSEQGYQYGNGRVSVVTPAGETVWSFAPEDAMVFDAEQTPNGTILVSVGVDVAEGDCPAPYDEGRPGCIRNRVVELAYPDERVVWEYAWYDAYPENHEVHDADRLPSGDTVIADMGNDRVFVAAPNGSISWAWDATSRLGAGSRFWNETVPASERDRLRRQGPETDWTHLNDVDLLDNGNYLVSIRNFDVVVEIDPTTKRVVDVLGTPGETSTLDKQHNPDRLDETTLVADSENDRVVEYDADGERVWAFGGSRLLSWPRDADRLPNGNTLVTDSYNDRVIETDPDGEIVWAYRGAQMAYSADRLTVPERTGETVPGTRLDSRLEQLFRIERDARRVADWASFVFPAWVGAPELAGIALGTLALAWLVLDAVVVAIRRRLSSGERGRI